MDALDIQCTKLDFDKYICKYILNLELFNNVKPILYLPMLTSYYLPCKYTLNYWKFNISTR